MRVDCVDARRAAENSGSERRIHGRSMLAGTFSVGRSSRVDDVQRWITIMMVYLVVHGALRLLRDTSQPQLL